MNLRFYCSFVIEIISECSGTTIHDGSRVNRFISQSIPINTDYEQFHIIIVAKLDCLRQAKHQIIVLLINLCIWALFCIIFILSVLQ